MSKLTLLEMVQDILNDLDSDEVNSIDDTVEASQVAQIIKSCYEAMMVNKDWKHQRKLIQLEALGSLSRPNYLKLPERLKELSCVKYDCQNLSDDRSFWKDLKYLAPEDFLSLTSQRDSSQTNVRTITDFGGSSLLIRNDVAPSYYTSFDDVYVVTDAYDNAVDDSLQQSKTQCLAYILPLWEAVDDFIPDLPAEAFPLLVEDAKSTAFVTLKQMPNPKAEQKVLKHQRWLSRKAWRTNKEYEFKGYGRS